MKRRDFLKQTALLPLLGGNLAWSEEEAGDAVRPNFLFILCDDLGYGDLSCYGHPNIQTPRLDALAAEGVRLTDCYATSPVCSPSRAGILTGRNPNRCRIPDWIPENSPIHLQRSEITIATLLKQAGYRTGHCGKWHLNGSLQNDQPQPGDHGFDYWFSTQNNASPSHRNPKNFVRNGEAVGPLEGYSSGIIVDESIRFLKQVKEGPFALFVWFHSPHEPVATASGYTEMYDSVKNPEQAAYFGNVTQMDSEVGRLLSFVDQNGLRDNTLVMFTSDNGPETLNRYKGSSHSYGSPGPLRGMKLHVYEGGIRVPGMVRWPGVTKPGTVLSEPISGVDVLPTFCEAAGVEAPTDRAIDGASILPLFHAKPIDRKTPLFWGYDKALSVPKAALRKGDWKLLSDGEGKPIELFYLKDDVGETKNLLDMEPEIAKDLHAQLQEILLGVERDGVSKEME